MVAASAEALAISAYARDLGLDLGIDMYCDSAAALGITNRAGIGKVRHLRTQGLWVQEVRVSGRIAYKKVLGEKNPADLLTKHLGAEVIARHVDTLNMNWIEGRAESAPTLDSIESYLQTWFEDGTYHDDDADYNHDYDYDPSINELKKEVESERRKVRFAELVTVRPIPAVGKCKATPARGAGKSGTVWHSERSAGNLEFDQRAENGQAGNPAECNCGGQLRRGDGRPWSDAEDDTECTACAGRWHSGVLDPAGDARPSIDSVGIACEADPSERASDWHGAPIHESNIGLRVGPFCLQPSEARSAHDAIFSFYNFDLANAVEFGCSHPGPHFADSPRYMFRRRRSVWGRPLGVRQATTRVHVRGQAAHVPGTGASEASGMACGHVGSSS